MPSARHLRSAGKWVLITVYSRPGIEAMDAAGVLPAFAGIACLDAWAPCDTYRNVAGHASRNAHLLRELTAVTETGTRADVIWARQAMDALLARSEAGAESNPISPGLHSRYFHDAAAAGPCAVCSQPGGGVGRKVSWLLSLQLVVIRCCFVPMATRSHRPLPGMVRRCVRAERQRSRGIRLR